MSGNAKREKGKGKGKGKDEDTKGGDLWSWGSNQYSQLGVVEADENGVMKATQPQAIYSPQHVPGFVDAGTPGASPVVVAVACGQNHTLALTSGGDVFAWGRGDFGQCGLNTKLDQMLPRRIDSLPDKVSTIAAGLTHSLALTVSGAVFAWGEGRFGKLGQGRGLTVDQCSPVELESMRDLGITAVFAGGNSSAAIGSKGDIWCWGWNSNGQLGLGFSSDPESGVATPSRLGSRAMQSIIDKIDLIKGSELWGNLIALVKDATSVQTDRVGRAIQTIFTRSENTKREEQIKLIKDVVKWGASDETTSRLLEVITDVLPMMGVTAEEPAEGEGEYPFVKLVFGERHCAALTADSRLWTWGCNAHGQLGDGNTKDSMKPRVVEALKDMAITSLACGMAHTAVATSNGSLFTWGWAQFGRLGYDVLGTGDHLLPVRVEGGLQSERAAKVACGESHTVVLTDRSELWTWGYNQFGQLGYAKDETMDKVVPHGPVKLRGFEGATDLWCGNYHVIALVGRSEIIMQLCRDGNLRNLTQYMETEGLDANDLREARNGKGQTALHAAAISGHEALAAFILDKCQGIVGVRDNKGRLPLHFAAREGAAKCVKILVERSSGDANAHDSKGRTPLHVAARQRFADIAQLLVIHGADLAKQDSKGVAPRDYMTAEDIDRITRLTGNFDVVISHAPEQKDFAVRLCNGLTKLGIRAWVDDSSSILEDENAPVHGKSIAEQQMERRLGESKAVVWVVSSHSVASSRCKAELMMAKQLHKSLFSLWFEVIQDLPSDIEEVIYMQQLADFSDPAKFQENTVRLSRGITRLLEQEAAGGAGSSASSRRGKRRGETIAKPVLTEEQLAEEKAVLEELFHPAGHSPVEYLFISYSKGEQQVAVKLAKRLVDEGFRCFLGATSAQEDSAISEALIKSNALVLVLSPQSVDDPSVRMQLALAENRDIIFFPVPICGDEDIDFDPALMYTLARAPQFPLAKASDWDASVKQLAHAIRLGWRVQNADRDAQDLRTRIENTKAQAKQKEDSLERLYARVRAMPNHLIKVPEPRKGTK